MNQALKSLLLVMLVAAAAAGGWFAARRLPAAGASGDGAASGRRVLFYQSAMHPWIKSDQPGKCTICGMELTPVYEGEAAADAPAGLVALPESSVTVLGVTTVPVRRGPLVRTLRVAGTIDDDDTRHRFLSAYAGGRIERLFVNHVGAEVVAGQPLALFYSPQLLEAERQYLALHRRQAAPGEGADHAQLLEAARQRLRLLGLTDAQIAALPEKPPTNAFTEIVAPASGTVVNRFVYEGQYVAEGEKLFELADFSRMWFQFETYERDLPWLQVGQEVEVTTASVSGRVLRAPVTFIDPNVNELTRVARVRVELDNPPVDATNGPRRLLAHRSWAEGRVRVEAPEALLVPRGAVLNPGGEPVAYVETAAGTYEQRPLQLGRLGDDEAEVLAGLAEGERVVLRGNLLIDAQAQLNQAVHGGPPAPAAAALPALPDAAREALAGAFIAADRLRAALAADDFAAFQAALPDAAAKLAALPGQVPEEGWRPLAAAVAMPLAEAADLRAARAAFHPLSERLADLALAARAAGAASSAWKIYECPMTARAFDDAPAKARWFQAGAPVRNPWYGAAMLDCGTEVRR
jgi:Cu(I)/Ag(I) efflux system membrane fusion protein